MNDLIQNMLLIRQVERRIQREYGKWEMKSPNHLCIGHEAVAVGVCAALRQDDEIFCYYRSHGWFLAKSNGANLQALISELHGKSTGCAGGMGGSMHLVDRAAGFNGTSAIVGGSIPQALGAAQAFKWRGEDKIAVAVFGDGALETGVFRESMNLAVLRRLPVLFVCENNGFATNIPIQDRQPFPLLDSQPANDPSYVFMMADHAVKSVRRGSPVTLMFRVYRGAEHCGIGDPLEGLDDFLKHDPLAGVPDDPEIEARLDAAFAQARSDPWPQ